MEHSKLELSLEILQIHRDDVGPYVKIKVTRAGEQIDIRWGLDLYTYEHLSKLINSLFPKQFPTEDYKCFLSCENRTTPYPDDSGWLICQFSAQKARFSFPCSELFKANLAWLQNVDHPYHLENLSWEHWVETYFKIPRPQTGHMILKDRIRKQNLHIVAVVIPLCILASVGWLGSSFLNHAKVKQILAAPTPSTVLALTMYVKKNMLCTDTINQAPNRVTINETRNSALHSITSHTSIASDLNPKPSSFSEIYKLPTGEVALTFDDGPSPYTGHILQILAQNHIHATFFFIGTNVEHWPNVVQKAAEQGNEVEDHSVNHGNLTTMTLLQQRWEIENAAEKIEDYTNKPVILFRPPYEAFNETTKWILSQDGMTMALWNRDPQDWKAVSAAGVIHSVLDQPASGGIFLLHDKMYTMLALPSIIPAFPAQHLQFVVLPTSAT